MPNGDVNRDPDCAVADPLDQLRECRAKLADAERERDEAQIAKKIILRALELALFEEEGKPLGNAISRAKALLAVVEAANGDIENARATCGGDGLGCPAFRSYYKTPEQRWRKCGQCPMDALAGTIEALAALVAEPTLPKSATKADNED